VIDDGETFHDVAEFPGRVGDVGSLGRVWDETCVGKLDSWLVC